jgi:hypothetical protein
MGGAVVRSFKREKMDIHRAEVEDIGHMTNCVTLAGTNAGVIYTVQPQLHTLAAARNLGTKPLLQLP